VHDPRPKRESGERRRIETATEGESGDARGEGNEDTSSEKARPPETPEDAVETADRPNSRGLQNTMKKMLVLIAVAAMVAFAAPAFAANPFMDVPMNHWAYDAVSQLAASGVVSGYPDGSFKGGQPATRYEMASIVARALAKVDMDKASKQDLEMLKKLVVEFKDELDALGVKVDKLDARVAVLEERLGGWKLNGYFRTRYEWYDNRSDFNDQTNFNTRVDLIFTKYIDDKVKFYGQLRADDRDNNDATNYVTPGGDRYSLVGWRQAYLDVTLPWDVNMRIGKQVVDIFDEEGLYVDSDALFGDDILTGIRFDKNFGMGRFVAWVSHGDLNQGNDNGSYDSTANNMLNYFANDNMYNFGAMVKIQPNEKFGGRLFGYWWQFTEPWNFYDTDGNLVAQFDDVNFNVYGINAFVNFTPSVTLNLSYFQENLEDDLDFYNEDAPTAWQGILSVGQDVLKFTDLRIEYTSFSEGWLAYNDLYDNYKDSMVYALGTVFLPCDTTALFVRAQQKWSDKWSSMLRYVNVSFDDATDASAQAYTVSFTYNYTPALAFTLLYDNVSYDGAAETAQGFDEDHTIRFQTEVSF
jgi:hypothetical protein